MEIIETSVFTRQIQTLMTDEDYRLLQESLVLRPELGNLIQGSGGIRKVRWNLPGQGKRGGTRIIYFWAVDDETIFMLLAYAKNKQENLAQDQIQTLRKIVKSEFSYG